MPLSPSWVSGISACHFRTCWSLDELWILRVRPATFKYRPALHSKTTKTPFMQQACSFFSNPFLEFCLLTPTFSSTILFHMFVQAFSCYAIFRWIWTFKTYNLTDYQFTIGSFLPAITFMQSDRQIIWDIALRIREASTPCGQWHIWDIALRIKSSFDTGQRKWCTETGPRAVLPQRTCCELS